MNKKSGTQKPSVQQERLLSGKSPKDFQESYPFFKFLFALLRWVRRYPCVLLGVIFIPLSFFFYFTIAPAIGDSAGLAVGSWKGTTDGIAEGIKAGTEAALSAEDIVMKVENKMASSGNLQVLLVDLRLTDLYQQGDKYAALFCIKGDGIFSVDLTQSQATYSETQNQITITIPEPVFTSYLDDSALETLADYGRPIFNGSTINGYNGYLNSRMQIEQNLQEKLYGYDTMMEQAKTSALAQVELLARSVCGSTALVDVQFIEGEG